MLWKQPCLLSTNWYKCRKPGNQIYGVLALIYFVVSGITLNMKVALALLLLIGAAWADDCGVPSVDPDRADDFVSKIVGGTFATKNSLPWQIHLGYKSGWFGSAQWICGGTIISNKWILTAAHCIVGNSASSFIVRVGQTDSSIQEASAKNYNVKRIIKHPSYNANTINYDFALLEVDTIAFTASVKAACLPEANTDCAAGSAGIASGWGETLPNGRNSIQVRYPGEEERAVSTKLRQVKVNCVSRTTCNLADYYGGMITQYMLCAGTTGKDSCQGDSGGPFVQKDSSGRYTIVGVVSWGYGCGAAKKPGVYARVGSVRSWIQTNTGL